MDPGDEIYRAAGTCSERFDACLASPAPREHVVPIRSAQGDYNLWCSAIKATRRGKASLDYRLRNHQDVREVVCGLLDGLATALGRWARRAAGKYTQHGDEVFAASIMGDAELHVDSIGELPDSPSSTDSPVSWDAISDELSNPGSAQAEDAPSMDPVMAECMSYVKTTLDQLAKVSLAIRKAGNKYRFERVDRELDDDAFEEFRNYLTSIVLRAFPDPEAHGLSAEQKMKRVSDYGALTPVQKRLVHANVLRKHRIEFVTKSQKKGKCPSPGDIGLVKDLRRLGNTRAPTTSSTAGSQKSSRVQGSASFQPLVPEVSKAAPTPSVVLTAALTATEVGSRLDVKRFLSTQTPSKVTNLTRVGSTQAYPNCPKLGSDGLLICPYCDDVLPSSYAKMEKSWKAHVIQDLMPYSCFISECETPYELYLTAENLLAHMIHKHSSTCWTCNLCSSSDQGIGSPLTQTRSDFWSADAWVKHVKRVHPGRIKAAQLPVLVELSKRSVIGPLNCPLCDFSTDAVDSKIDDHILQHLHEFSLRALPDSSNLIAPDGESKASQMSGSLSHVKDVDHDDQRPLEYPITKQTQWSADLERLWEIYPSSSLKLLMDHVNGSPTVGPADSATAEFWGFHLFKVGNVIETIKSVRSSDMTEELITNIIDQTSISILDSLDWFNNSSPFNHSKDGPFSLDIPSPQRNMPFTSREAIQDQVEFRLFQQRSVIYLGSSSQPKHQPRVVLTGGSGVGKTVIAAELARQINEERPGCSVFWVDASDIRSVSGAYSRIWRTAGIPGNVASVETSLVYYLNWVSGGEWLMILDGIDRHTLHRMQLEGWLPSGLGGRLLLTTKDVSCLSLLGQATEVRVLPIEEEQLPFPVIISLPPSRPEDFDVAIICLSHYSYNAIQPLFSQIWKDPRHFGKASDKPSQTSGEFPRYYTGHIYGCNAVLALGSETDILPAEIRSKFKRIQLTLLVGACSGLPWAENGSLRGIFRGDVVISNEVVRYHVPDTNSNAGVDIDIIPPNEHVRPLLDIMASKDGLERVQKNTRYFLKQLQATSPKIIDLYAYPGAVEDRLFKLNYPHKHRGSSKCPCGNQDALYGVCSQALDSSCDALGCDSQYLIHRRRAEREEQPGPHTVDGAHEPSLHYGRIASFDKLIDSPEDRDIVSDTDSSALALMSSQQVVIENLPCIVIQGVRDYADIHNRLIWSDFAAATAASAAKAILGEYSRLSPWMVPFDKETRFIGREEVLTCILSKIPPGISEDSCQRIAIIGPEGVGKTQVALEAARLFRRQYPDCSVFWVSGRSANDLTDGFRAIGRRLRVCRVSEDDLRPGEDMESRVKMELDSSSAGKWLLIIDDLNDDIPKVLVDWVPSNPDGSVLFISRHRASALLLSVPEKNVIPVPTMNGEEATEIFRKCVGESQLGSTATMADLLDKLQYSHREIIQACAAISASGTPVIEHLQYALANSKTATTQPKKGEKLPKTDQEDQTDQQTIKPQPGVTGETPTTVTPLSDEVNDEEKGGVWGYLIPIHRDRGKDPIIVLKKYVVEREGAVEDANPSNKVKQTYKKPGRERHGTALSQPNPSGGFLIGRHPDCDLVVDDPAVSNRHCLLFWENRAKEVVALIEDLSSNGTFVNEAIVGQNCRRDLKDNDEITILDKARFVFTYPVTRPTGNTFLQNYTVLERIGKNHYAEFFRCVEKSTGQLYAVKVFTRIPGSEERSILDGLHQEIAVLRSVSHPNIVSLKDTFTEQNTLYLVLDLLPANELFDLIVQKEKLTEQETRNIFSLIVDAVKYLHDRNIIHRDIKPENIILSDQDWNLKLVGFGLAKVVGDEDFTTTLCGTLSYVAPEILCEGRHRMYNKAVDIWSLGVVLYVCLCGFPPFSDELYSTDFPYTISQQIGGGRFDYPSPYWDSVGDPALDLIDQMLVVDPGSRFTVDQCIAHPWMIGSPSGVPPTPSRRGSRVEGHEVPRRGIVRERTLLSAMNSIDLDSTFCGFDETNLSYESKGVAEAPESGIVAEPEEL
ncbi:hypothetical protein E0Z10_g4569 [Xylaria hypoxylon]|uniref:CAMK protein kinase n=1 Tax=Xylaria hypoxylon TaxID=37992 RepID=A0A4Z0Z084_9PEZI|nr:hypothetical protein E0Z10_g4569 [Xylaria hypoxylon]